MLVCCLGDLLLDVVVRLRQPLASGADATATTTLSPGGQAANVAAWVVELGGAARFVGKHGDDPGGTLARELFAAYGVETLGPHVRATTGTVVSLVSPGGDRTMCTDRGVAPTLTLDEIDPAWLADIDHLHVSGYALLAEPIRDAALGAIAMAETNGARVSVDLSSWSLIRDAGPDVARGIVERAAPDVVFANEQEAAIIGGPTTGSTWIVKRGARGCSFDGDERSSVAVERVVDTTGAGDALAAGWIVGGPDVALAAAARCIGQAGAMP
jgi:sugar/nucleoside kinase (ribokinase family)